jgi:cell division protein FtsB|tara:strand:+ start:2410 stop:2718 length:309 start_codon:yes stop_codon:yes gene_type:complete
MNRPYYFLVTFLILLIILLSKNIFFSENNYSKRNDLIKDNTIQEKKNIELNKENEILQFEIMNAQNSNDHVENFAREKLNLTYPEEDFVSFKEDKEKNDEKK